MDLLLAAMRQTPRPYRLPPLPPDVAAAAAAGPATALAFAIETARLGKLQRATPHDEVRDLFTRSLAQLLAAALDPASGDAAFQALVLRGQEEVIQEYVRLTERAAADRRAIRVAVNAVAHPAKLRLLPPGRARDTLAELHELAETRSWPALAEALERQSTLQAVREGEPLQRLLQAGRLAQHEAVQRYIALCERRGPIAGSGDAAAQGRASLRVGDAAEHATLQVFRQVAALLDAHEGARGRYRAVRGLRTPAGFPGEPGNAKDEWDAALLRTGGDAADVVLLAEVKASPSAAAPDYTRLQRGLLRLSHADAHEAYDFPSDTGLARIAGESLRRLRPHGRSLPPHVIYCCAAPVESQPPMLGAAAEAVLLAEPGSLAYAHRLARGEALPHEELRAVWQQLATAPHLRSALHQYDTAQAAREAMLRPQDLLDALVSNTGTS